MRKLFRLKRMRTHTGEERAVMMAVEGVIFQFLAILSLLPALYTTAPLQKLSTATRPESSRPGEIWTNCSATGNPVDIQRVSIYPYPPKRGHRVSLLVDLTLMENVTSGKVEAELKYGILPLFNKTWSLCDFAKEQGWQCPLIPGAFRVHFNTTVPSFAPHGHVTGRGLAKDQRGSELVCVAIDFQI